MPNRAAEISGFVRSADFVEDLGGQLSVFVGDVCTVRT